MQIFTANSVHFGDQMLRDESSGEKQIFHKNQLAAQVAEQKATGINVDLPSIQPTSAINMNSQIHNEIGLTPIASNIFKNYVPQ